MKRRRHKFEKGTGIHHKGDQHTSRRISKKMDKGIGVHQSYMNVINVNKPKKLTEAPAC
jgi:hypothetical protein